MYMYVCLCIHVGGVGERLQGIVMRITEQKALSSTVVMINGFQNKSERILYHLYDVYTAETITLLL